MRGLPRHYRTLASFTSVSFFSSFPPSHTPPSSSHRQIRPILLILQSLKNILMDLANWQRRSRLARFSNLFLYIVRLFKFPESFASTESPRRAGSLKLHGYNYCKY